MGCYLSNPYVYPWPWFGGLRHSSSADCQGKERMEFGRRKPLSLLELCVRKAIDNLRYMESVDGVEMDLLKRILPHCTLEHLTNIEKNTKVSQFP